MVRVQKAVDILKDRAKITTDEGELLNSLLYTIKESGEMEQALVDWEALAEDKKTWKEAKSYFTKKYAEKDKHASIDAKTAGYGSHSANQLKEEEDSAIAAEILAQLRAGESNSMQKMLEQQQQMLESNQKLMMELMKTILTNRGATSGNANGGGGTSNQRPGTKEKWTPDEWQITNKGESIEHEGKTWWWCPRHREGKGMYVTHKPEDHDTWAAAKALRAKNRNKKNE